MNRLVTMTLALVLLMVGGSLCAHGGWADDQAPTGLMIELLANPGTTVVRDAHPEFTWVVPSARQSAYQIVVSVDGDASIVWDSGKVASDASVSVSFAGDGLLAGQGYRWKVRTWDERDTASAWSVTQAFTMAGDLGGYTTSTYPLQQVEVEPVEMIKKGKGNYFVDFGKAAFGYLLLDVKNVRQNCELRIELGEKTEDGNVDRRPGGTIRYARTKLTVEKGSGTYRVETRPDKRNTSGAAIRLPEEIGVVMPFRYVEIRDYPGKLDKSMIRQVMVHYPFDEDASRFESSDETLNAVWDLCKYSLKATSFCGVYVDGDRERIPYEADAYINQLLHYGVDREYTLARHSHEYLMTHPTWPTEWILDSVLMAWLDYMYTGDAESLRHWYDDLKHKTLTSLAREYGLISTTTGLVTEEVLKSIHIDKPIRDNVDWPPANFTQGGQYGERDGYDMVAINTVINSFHYEALSLMSRIADALGKADDAAFYQKAAKKVYGAINEKLFDPERGVYVDGEGTAHSAIHANMMPLALGLVPEARKKTVVDFIKSRGMACSVYGAQFLLDALYLAEEDDYALELMTAKHDRSWWNMIAVGSTVTLEAWDWKYKNNLDWNHAWGAAPGNVIPRHLMGVRPLEPGFGRALIKPQPGTLETASAKIPTIRGPISVAFKNAPGESFELEVTLPGNVSAEVHVPTANAETVTEGGKAISQSKGIVFLRMEAGRAVFEVGSGDYRLRSSLKK